MKKLVAIAITAFVLALGGSPANAHPQAAAYPQAENYLEWLDDRMRLWPIEIARLESSPVASRAELARLKNLMEKVEGEAAAIADGRALSKSPVQLQVLTIETELERLAGEADRLPIVARSR